MVGNNNFDDYSLDNVIFDTDQFRTLDCVFVEISRFEDRYVHTILEVIRYHAIHMRMWGQLNMNIK